MRDDEGGKFQDIQTRTAKLGREVEDTRREMEDIQREIEDIETKLQSGRPADPAELGSKLRDLKTKHTKLESEATKLQSETWDVQIRLQGEFRDFWDVQVKAANYLMIAHAAGLVTCVTLLKEYKDNAQLKGIGVFIGLFGSGLMVAIMAFALLLTQRMLFLDTDVRLRKFVPEIRRAARVSGISCVILLAAIVVAIWKFSSL
jgi:hypothetical protein